MYLNQSTKQYTCHRYRTIYIKHHSPSDNRMIGNLHVLNFQIWYQYKNALNVRSLNRQVKVHNDVMYILYVPFFKHFFFFGIPFNRNKIHLRTAVIWFEFQQLKVQQWFTVIYLFILHGKCIQMLRNNQRTMLKKIRTCLIIYSFLLNGPLVYACQMTGKD